LISPPRSYGKFWVGNSEEDQKMEVDFDEVKTTALQLSIKERAQLAGKLLLSLDESSESEIERLWLNEAEHRLKEYREGRVQGIPADEVYRRAIDYRS
jgi:putative addiction module component (TIGR02574 family)